MTISIAMSSAAAGMERDAAEGAAVAYVPGMDDRIAALKAERQALKTPAAAKPVEKSRPRLVQFHPCVPCLCW